MLLIAQKVVDNSSIQFKNKQFILNMVVDKNLPRALSVGQRLIDAAQLDADQHAPDARARPAHRVANRLEQRAGLAQQVPRLLNVANKLQRVTACHGAERSLPCIAAQPPDLHNQV
ncbi:hypothetical protein SE17_06645, partial [Kouleothrix aurantiaca]